MAASSSAHLYTAARETCRCHASSPSTPPFNPYIIEPNNTTPRSSSFTALGSPESVNIPSAVDDAVPLTPMRMMGLIGPKERTEDQDPPPRVNGPLYVVLFGKDTHLGDYYICGVFTDLDIAVQCTDGGGNPPFAFNCYDVAWWYWLNAWQARATAPHLHPRSIWHSVVTYDALMERGHHNTCLQRSSSSAPASPTLFSAAPTAQASCTMVPEHISICTPPGTPLETEAVSSTLQMLCI
ncbi:hypothetical protein NM688_g2114 [Phlebia brevispora]|uniref:Uncharacterized protein n=1 Tax=Phlebia brevispora TaxID=194682 RepID=A0ACC1T9F3_9APHY|nr:hypothetical protein NM688_g2114 [Phlebia brevispora]